MKLEYENGALRIENAEGRRWQLNDAEKPRFSFPFDAMSVTSEHALRRLGTKVAPLSEVELEEVLDFVGRQVPPPSATLQRQYVSDLKVFSYGLINTIVTQLEYDNLLDVHMTGREGSEDFYASEARRVLSYVDTVWNAYYGLAAQISGTPDADLKSFNDYANMMPMPPAIEHFLSDVDSEPPEREAAAEVAHPSRPASKMTAAPADTEKLVSLERVPSEKADFSKILNRALVIDNFFSSIQLKMLEQWALTTPHWMLTNSSYNEKGAALHRIWGASYIEAYHKSGWPGLPPSLSSAITKIFRTFNITITQPEYIGLNGQFRGQDASMHTDCEVNSPDDLSILLYIGEETSGDLLLFDKTTREQLLHRIEFRPNRIVAFDGSIPHQALAPDDDKFRISLIVRGKYECRSPDPIALIKQRSEKTDPREPLADRKLADA